jgi:uncharacterized metal-binding protein YceD (DUF177 family)
MKSNEFVIPFVGLKIGKHLFEYHIDSAFFENYECEKFEKININFLVQFEKKTTFFELNFKHKGTIQTNCDVTDEIFDLNVKGNFRLIVQMGEQYNHDNEELLIIPFGSYQIDIKQYIYENIMLSIPLKRVKTENKKIKIQKEEKNIEIDPRWDKLKQIIID